MCEGRERRNTLAPGKRHMGLRGENANHAVLSRSHALGASSCGEVHATRSKEVNLFERRGTEVGAGGSSAGSSIEEKNTL